MKILTVIYSLGKGGTERSAINFAIGYSNLNHDSRILVTKKFGIRKSVLEANKIKIYQLKSISDQEEIKDWIPDIVHFHSHGMDQFDFDKISELTSKAKFIETNAFTTPTPWIKKIDLHLQLTEWCYWRFMRKTKNKYKDKTGIIANPILCNDFYKANKKDISKFKKKYGIEECAFILGRVGQAIDSKWSPLLIKIFDKLCMQNDNLTLLLVNPSSEVKKAVEISKFKKNIKIIPIIKDINQMRICYSVMNIFLHISRIGESFGYVIAESLLCETPVVTLHTPWADNSQSELVGNRKGGFTVFQKKNFIKAVQMLINNEKLRLSFGIRGRERIKSKYDHIFLSQIVIDKLINSVDFYKQKKVNSPYLLCSDVFDKVDFLSKLLLVNRFGFYFLKLTSGYASPLSFILFSSKNLLNKVKRKISLNLQKDL